MPIYHNIYAHLVQVILAYARSEDRSFPDQRSELLVSVESLKSGRKPEVIQEYGRG